MPDQSVVVGMRGGSFLGAVGGGGADEVDGGESAGPVLVAVDGVGAGGEPAGVEGVEGVGARLATPLGGVGVEVGGVLVAPTGEVGRGGVIADVAVGVEGGTAGDEVVLAAPPDEVAGILEDFEEAGLIGTEHVVHGAVAAGVGVPAGHEGAAGGGADRVLAEGVAEGDGLGGDEVVEGGGDGGRVAHVAERVAAPLVGIEDENVRTGHMSGEYIVTGQNRSVRLVVTNPMKILLTLM